MGNCDCEKMEIYYTSLNILFPISIPEKGFRDIGVTNTINDSLDIQHFFDIIENLERFDKNYGELDVRILVDLFCTNRRKVTLTANSGIVKIGNKYLDPNPEFFDFFDSTVEKKRNDWKEANENMSP